MKPQKPKAAKNELGESRRLVPPITPFEFAQTAIALCRLAKKDPELIPPTKFFSAAAQLLSDAKKYLGEDWEANSERWVTSFIHGNDAIENCKFDGKPIPFSRLLRPLEKLETSKKHRTLLGAITTRNGLEKAIRRYFSKQDATRIIQANAMSHKEWKTLLDAQKRAIQNRATKRVKGLDGKKSQPV